MRIKSLFSFRKWLLIFLSSKQAKKIEDAKYIKMKYYAVMGKKLNIDDPKTFNEKLQWFKLYDRKDIYTTMVDKYAVKEYVAKIIGEKYVIPTIGTWETFEEINFESLPNQFVLKCTHDSGGLVICRDKKQFDIETARAKIDRSLKRDYYPVHREWPYKNVKKQIIAEKFMMDGDNVDLPVYKFFCFNGDPKIIQVIQNDKQPNESIDYFDTQWKLLDLKQNFPNSQIPIVQPPKLDEMLRIVKTLANKKPGFLRVDLYSINGEVFFSEFTFFSDSGMAEFEPPAWDDILGSWIEMPVTGSK